MKKDNQFLQFAVIVYAIGFSVGILYLVIVGYRPLLPSGAVEPNWNAISVFATIAFSASTIFISCLALYQSINATKQQNKIALFEKRYEVYYELTKIKRIAFFLNDSKNGINSPEKLLMDLRLLINEEYPELEELRVIAEGSKTHNINDSISYVKLRNYIQRFPELRAKSMLLFEVELNPFITYFSQMIFDLYHTSGLADDIITYITSYDDFMRNFVIFLNDGYKQIENQLKL